MVDRELLARNEYLATENRILKDQLKGRLMLSDAERATERPRLKVGGGASHPAHRRGCRGRARACNAGCSRRFSAPAQSSASRRMAAIMSSRVKEWLSRNFDSDENAEA
jgi:hypothetical protein